jgi:AcrR family transcriptional regulator
LVITLNVTSNAMQRPRPSKEEVVIAYRRSGLLDAALRVFGARGFEAATMDAIARDARVAKGTIYLYYKSKRSIYDAALRHGLAELERLTRERLRTAGTLQDTIAAFIRTRAEYFDERRDFFRMYVAEIGRQAAGAAAPAWCRAALDRQTHLLRNAVESAIGRGEIRAVDAAATAQAMFDLTRGMVARRLSSHQRSHLSDDVKFLVDLIWRGLDTGSRRR